MSEYEGWTMDEAWTAADVATPPGARFEGIRRSMLGMKQLWVASYSDEGGWFNFYGETPVEAALALAWRGKARPSAALHREAGA